MWQTTAIQRYSTFPASITPCLVRAPKSHSTHNHAINPHSPNTTRPKSPSAGAVNPIEAPDDVVAAAVVELVVVEEAASEVLKLD